MKGLFLSHPKPSREEERRSILIAGERRVAAQFRIIALLPLECRGRGREAQYQEKHPHYPTYLSAFYSKYRH